MLNEPVPVVAQGAREGLSGLGLTFVAVVKCAEGRTRFASLHALDDLVVVGSMKWDSDDDGEVAMIQVHPGWRRRGVATALWRVAVEIVESQGWAAPQHSPQRTAEGDAWARTMGAAPAEEITTLDVLTENRRRPHGDQVQ